MRRARLFSIIMRIAMSITKSTVMIGAAWGKRGDDSEREQSKLALR